MHRAIAPLHVKWRGGGGEAVWCAFVALWLVLPAHAQRLYQWTDAAGQVNSSDDLAEVPEPWRSRFEREDREREARAAGQGQGEQTAGGATKTVRQVAPGQIETVITPNAEPAPAATAPSDTPADTLATGKDYMQVYRDREKAAAKQRAEWQNKVRAARQQLAGLKKRKAELRLLRRAANQRYLATAAPAARAERTQLREEYEAAKAEIARLEAYLAEGIYEEARKAGVPPGWIRDAK